MKILYICGDHGIPAFGRKGASTHLREMIAAFRELGHEISLAAADLGGDCRSSEDFPMRKLPAPRSRKLGVDGRYLYANMAARRALRQLAEEVRPDAIYERSALYFGAGEWIAQRLGVPRILEVNALLSEEQKTRLHFPNMAHKKEAALIKRAPGVAAISNYMVKELVALGRPPEDTRPFPMAVNPSIMERKGAPDELRKQLGWGSNSVVLGYIGSMNHYHQPSWFMELADKFLRRGEQDLRFLVVGGSSEKVERFRGRLMRWVDEGYVHFTGSVPQEDMAQWLEAMDVVLVPGAAPQSTPTKIFETGAIGRPIILPATEPIQDLCGAKAGYLFQPQDFQAFENKVREFLANPARFQDDAQELHKRVLDEHTWQKRAEQISHWFEELQDRTKTETRRSAP